MLAAAGMALAGGGVAHAVTIGSDLTASPSFGVGTDDTAVQTVAPTGAPNPVTSPIDGVIVQIRSRYGTTDTDPGTLAFRILSGTNPFTARPATVDGGELRFPLLRSLPAGSDDFIDYRPIDANGRPIGIPIAAGERVAIAQTEPGSARIVAAATGGRLGYVAGQHLSGSLTYTELSGYEMSVQAVVEPDADGDHRGDLTQDQCPTLANDPTTGLCPPQLVTREVTREVEVQKCHVPLLRGLSRGLASRLLTASGCRLGAVTRRAVRRGPSGRVLTQSARSGTVVAFGTKVDVAISKRAVARHRRH